MNKKGFKNLAVLQNQKDRTDGMDIIEMARTFKTRKEFEISETLIQIQ